MLVIQCTINTETYEGDDFKMKSKATDELKVGEMKISEWESSLYFMYKYKQGEYTSMMRGQCLNPIHLLTIDLPVEHKAKMLEAFEEYAPNLEIKDAIKFNNDGDKEKYIKEILGGIDEFARFIDNFNDWKNAESMNGFLGRKAQFIKEHDCIPKTIGKKGFDVLINQAFGIVAGLEVRSDEFIIAHLIRWIKKLGFTKAKVDEKKKIAYYTFTMLGEHLENAVTMCYEVKKANGKYKVRFFYDTPSKDQLDDGYVIYNDETMRKEITTKRSSYYSAKL